MAKAKKTETTETPAKKPAAKPMEKAAPAAAPKAASAPKAAAAPAPSAKAAAPAAKSTPAAAPVSSKKSPAKKPAPAPSGMPLIDTGLAAQSAAAMLLNRAVTGDAGSSAPKAESSTFRNLKDQLAKPKPAGLSHILGTTGDSKKGPSHFANQQRGHNQTYGGFNKTGVPRRTNG